LSAVAKLHDACTDAAPFLHMLGERHTFQTFDDAGKGRAGLSRILHGTLADHAGTLTQLNARGAGAFVMVNAGDGKGRKAANVQAVRAAFVDLDGAPLEPVEAAPLAPHCVVETSPRRWHAYWRVSDCPLPDFTPLQKALASRFAADPKVCDLPRVMRIPGFWHRKGAPFLSRIVEIREAEPYTLAELRGAFDFDAAPVTPHKLRALPSSIPEGKRNATLYSLACGLVQKGYGPQAVIDRLQRINAERCTPQLCALEVDTIAANASAAGSRGFVLLPHRFLDSPELNRLPLPTRWIILTAYRRYDGGNNGNIALTHADCRHIPGCADEDAFTRHRAAAVDSGFLILAQPGRMTRNGKTPNRYAIPDVWMPSHPPRFAGDAHTQRLPGSYIDIQIGGS
jgi:hypothetical protein